MPPSLVKPPRWAWNPALLEPKFQSLARGLNVLISLWDDGSAVDLISNRIATNDPTSKAITPYGTATSIPASSTAVPYWASPAEANWDWNPADDGISVVVLCDIQETSTTYGGLLAFRTGNNNGQWRFGTVNKDMTFAWRAAFTDYATNELNDEGTDTYTSPIFGNFNLYAVSQPTGAAGQLYRNGVKLAMNAQNTALPAAGNENLVLGAQEQDDLLSRKGDYLLAAKWNRPLSDDEQALLAADPFGLLRRNDVVSLTVPTIVELSTTVTSTSTVTADLSNLVTTELSTTVTSTSTVTTAVDQIHDPTVTVTSVSTVAVDLENLAVNELAATATSTSTVTVGVLQGHNLSTVVTATSIVTADLTVEALLSATITSVTSVVAALEQIHELGATPSAISTLTASLAATAITTRGWITLADTATGYITMTDTAVTIITVGDS